MKVPPDIAERRSKMKRRLLKALSIVVFLLVGAGVGYVIGATYWWWRAMDMLSFDRADNLSVRVIALSRLRTEDKEGAVGVLERHMDTGIRSLDMGMGRKWVDLPKSVQRALMTAKVYRTAFPPDPNDRALIEALDKIPILTFDGERKACDPAFQKILEMAQAKGEGSPPSP